MSIGERWMQLQTSNNASNSSTTQRIKAVKQAPDELISPRKPCASMEEAAWRWPQNKMHSKYTHFSDQTPTADAYASEYTRTAIPGPRQDRLQLDLAPFLFTVSTECGQPAISHLRMYFVLPTKDSTQSS